MYSSWGRSSALSPPRDAKLGGVACHPQRPCMFDQSPHWGLGTAFPSVLRPLLIRAKLGRWV